MLAIVENATANCLPHLVSLARSSSTVQIILLAQSLVDYESLSKDIDSILQRGSTQFPHIVPLTDLQVTQRLVYSLVSQSIHQFHPSKADQHSINELASFCCGSPAIVHLMEAYIVPREDGVDLTEKLERFNSEFVKFTNNTSPLDADNDSHHSSSAYISIACIINSMPLSSAGRCLLNCLSMFRNVPVPKPFLIALDNEIIHCTEDMTSNVKQLQEINCLRSYPNPVILSTNENSKRLPLFYVPDVIAEGVKFSMTHDEQVIAIVIATKSLKKSVKNDATFPYLSGMVEELVSSFMELKDEYCDDHCEEACYIDLLSLSELLRENRTPNNHLIIRSSTDSD